MKTTPRVSLMLAAALLPAAASGQTTTPDTHPFLNPLFTDNMVMQRGQSDPIWGWTTPGAAVTVTLGNQSAKAMAGADGEWLAKLPAPPTGGPYTMTVAGPQTVTLNNVLIGDVWICSGQSNMEFGVGNLTNADQEIAAADYPQIRLFRVNNKVALSPQTTVAGTSAWEICTPDNLRTDGDWGGFSAVGYFFGRDLYQDLKIPIGLIHTSWGGTPAQAWTSEQALQSKVPDYRPRLLQINAAREAERTGSATSLAQRLQAWYSQNDPGSAGVLGWAEPALDDGAWATMTLPGYLQNAGPALAKTNGVVWFRRTFDVPADAAGKDLVLHMLADDNDTTWVNGTQVGATEGYDQKRAYRIASALLKPTGNVLVVRVLDTGGVGGIYGTADTLALEVPGGQMMPLGGPWRYKLGVDLTKATALPTSVDQYSPTTLYNGMVSPLIPFGVKGAIWYQGESNAGQAYQYRTLLPTMIGDWRNRWNEGRFPFLIVQLAGFTHAPAQPGDDAWAELREAQWMTAQDTPNTGIATAIDIGNPDDIHPKNKQEVGRRLALVAREQVYHEAVEAFGPVYKSMKTEDGSVRLTFDHAGGGLVTQDGGPAKGFAVAGADHKWAWADAKIDGVTIIVSSPDVPHPVAVRYAWAAGPLGNLASQDGLPMFPFRTDQWPGITVANK